MTSFENIIVDFFKPNILLKIPNYLKENVIWAYRLILNNYNNLELLVKSVLFLV